MTPDPELGQQNHVYLNLAQDKGQDREQTIQSL